MKKVISPGTAKKTITLIDNVVYSHVKDLKGNPLELKMSLMLQNGNSELRLATGADDPKEDHSPKPVLVWIPGGGYRGTDKNLMLGEMSEFANAGYVVASIYYRSSAQGHFPTQIIDVKTAIRFLRANAKKYEVDVDHVGVFGRSAGGHLAAFTAMNLDGFDSSEWAGYSSKVQACCDMFGPVDFVASIELEEKRLADPNFHWKMSDPTIQWHGLEETHEGALLGGDPATMKERGKAANAVSFVNERMCPIQIFHGDNDPLVPVENSESLYNRMVEASMEDKIEFYILKGAGHGSREFFQDSVKKLMIDFFDRYLKKA